MAAHRPLGGRAVPRAQHGRRHGVYGGSARRGEPDGRRRCRAHRRPTAAELRAHSRSTCAPNWRRSCRRRRPSPFDRRGTTRRPSRCEGELAVTGPWLANVFTVADAAVVEAIGLSGRDPEQLADVGVLIGGNMAEDRSGAAQSVTTRTEDGPLTFEFVDMIDRPPCGRTRRGAGRSRPEGGRARIDDHRIRPAGVSPHVLTDGELRRLQSLSEAYGWVGEHDVPPSGVDARHRGLDQLERGFGLRRLPRPRRRFDRRARVAVHARRRRGRSCPVGGRDARNERDVLVAVGAAPRSIRRVSALKALLLAGVGGLLAVPAGFVPVAVIIAEQGPDPIDFPWLVALGCVVAVPLLVGAFSLAGSAIAQRVKPAPSRP